MTLERGSPTQGEGSSLTAPSDSPLIGGFPEMNRSRGNP